MGFVDIKLILAILIHLSLSFRFNMASFSSSPPLSDVYDIYLGGTIDETNWRKTQSYHY